MAKLIRCAVLVLVAITVATTAPNVLAVNPGVKAATLQELIALAKADPQKLSYASPGIGGTPHLAMEMLKVAAGINVRHVPYPRGLTAAILDVVAGNVDMVFGNLTDMLPQVQGGRLRAGGRQRWPPAGASGRASGGRDVPGLPQRCLLCVRRSARHAT